MQAQTLFSVLVELRHDLLQLADRFIDAPQNTLWSSRAPYSNAEARRILKRIVQEYIDKSTSFGTYKILRHCCDHVKGKYKFLIEHEYDFKDLHYKTNTFVWSEYQLSQGPRSCRCPCNTLQSNTDHNVIEEFLFDPDYDQGACKAYAEIACSLAKCSIGDGQPRSSARERMLRTVLKINDFLLPTPVDEYITKIQAFSTTPAARMPADA